MIKQIIYSVIVILFIACSGKPEEKEVKDNSRVAVTEEEENYENIPPIKVSFPSIDSLMIQADIYEVNDSAPVILLCHQARWNKTEYAEIAPKLNSLGFNCIAIDQRSGGTLNDSLNVTHERAVKKGLPVDYLDAEKDIIAAIQFASRRYKQEIILWGSSYSSTLALYDAFDNDMVRAVVSFSPGDYFQPEKVSLKRSLKYFEKPYFVTSSKEEAEELTKLFSEVKKDEKHVQFIPNGNGKHGSSALWQSEPDNEEYWKAVSTFLNLIK